VKRDVRQLVDQYLKVTEAISRLQAEADRLRDELVQLIPNSLIHNGHRVTVVPARAGRGGCSGIVVLPSEARACLTPRVRRLFRLTIPVSSLWGRGRPRVRPARGSGSARLHSSRVARTSA
jgi:hypothetical protein